MAATRIPTWIPRHGETYDVGGHKTAQSISHDALDAFMNGGPVPKATAYIGQPGGWENVASRPEYYQTNEDMKILDKYSEALLEICHEKQIVWEIGPGDFTKTRWLIAKLFESWNLHQKPLLYLITDISASLQLGVAKLAREYPANAIHIAGLGGSDEDGLKYIQHHQMKPCVLLNLGSFFFNKGVSDLKQHLPKWKSFFEQGHELWASQDGHDSKDQKKIEAAYGSAAQTFVCENFCNVIAEAAGEQLIDIEEWRPFRVFRPYPHPHHIIGLEAKSNIRKDRVVYDEGHKLTLFTSFKYGPSAIDSFCEEHGLAVRKTFGADESKMHHYLIAQATGVGNRSP
ncbi:hypothetical protein F66182_4981 [Fusarium sp. NRRL 66182]|nr:hypothetical protein F66182_4981 [Fusarium sp. NRRL 66182]